MSDLLTQFLQATVQETMAEDKADFVRKWADNERAYRTTITPVGRLMSIMYSRKAYLQQHANYANPACVRWALKSLFVLSLLRGAMWGVDQWRGGWVRGNWTSRKDGHQRPGRTSHYDLCQQNCSSQGAILDFYTSARPAQVSTEKWRFLTHRMLLVLN